jgi:hypothetical protein
MSSLVRVDGLRRILDGGEELSVGAISVVAHRWRYLPQPTIPSARECAVLMETSMEVNSNV